MFKERRYRDWVESGDLISFEVKERETDLFILADKKLENQARESVLAHRAELEKYIRANEEFYTSLEPLDIIGDDVPDIVISMAEAARIAGVGPMAAVAGAMAEFVGRDLLAFTSQVIIENGGDIFLKSLKTRTLGVYAGDNSPFTGKLAIEIPPYANGIGVCTSSGTVSHSLSFGSADAALIISENTALADACATATGNIVKSASNIEEGINFARSIDGIKGVLIMVGDKMGSWGEIKLI